MKLFSLLTITLVALATLVLGQIGQYSRMVQDYYKIPVRFRKGDGYSTDFLRTNNRKVEAEIDRLKAHMRSLRQESIRGSVTGATIQERVEALAALMDRIGHDEWERSDVLRKALDLRSNMLWAQYYPSRSDVEAQMASQANEASEVIKNLIKSFKENNPAIAAIAHGF